MNFKTTLFLLALLIIVGSGYWLAERKSGPNIGDTVITDGGTALFTADNFVTTAVTAVSIQDHDQTIHLAKTGTDWHQTAPVEFPLQTWPTQQLGDDAAKLRHVEKLNPARKSTPTLADIGLSPPKAVVTFYFDDTGTNSTQTIKLGQRLTLGGRGYVMVNDDPHLYVVNDDLHKHVLGKKINDLRKKSLEAPTPGKADRVTLRRGDLAIDMIKADTKWAFSSPHSGRVDTEAVKNLLNDISGIYIRDFIADQPESLSVYGLDQPQTTVTVYAPAPPTDSDTDNEKPHGATVRILRIGSPVDLSNEQYFASWSRFSIANPIVFTISKSSAEEFDKSVDDMRDPRITPIPRKDIREIAFDSGVLGVFKLLYSDGEWAFAEPKPDYRADPIESRKLVETITDAKAASYASAAEVDGPPATVITLTAVGRPQPDILKVFPTGAANRHMVLRNDETTGYLVPADDLKRLSKPMLSLRHRLVLDFPAASLSELTIKRPDGVTYEFVRQFQDPQTASEPRPWQLAGHDKFENKALEYLLDQLLPLQATSWVDNVIKPGETFSLNFKTHQGDHAKMILDVNSRIASCVGQQAATPFDIKGFQFSDELLQKLDAEFRYRTMLEFKTNDITKVTVTRADDTTVVTKNSNGDYIAEGSRKLDQSKAAGLYDTLAGLRAKRFKDGPQHEVDESKTLTITIEANESKPITLTIDTQRSLGHLSPSWTSGAQWFNIDPEDISKLDTDLTVDSKEESTTKTS